MTEEIKNLIEKINKEGIEAAERKKKELENQARLEAEEILAKAKKDAAKLISGAEEKISSMEGKSRALLAQAGRDLLLSLRKEIDAMLEKIILADLRQALNPEALFKMILEIIKVSGAGQKGEIIISLKREDAEALQQQFFSRLKEETKKAITLKPAEDVLAGFTISFDAGKSQYDFTDKALAEYIGSSLKPKLNQLLKDAVS